MNPVSQTITFNALGNVAFGSGNVTLLASASSGLPVSFASTTTGVCTVAGNLVTLAGAGTCSITASQAGNASYAAASNVVQAFTVAKAIQAITFGTPGDVTYGVAPFGISATASSGLPVSFASTTSSICTVSGSVVTTVAAGSCSITASQVGNSNFLAATPISQTFNVLKITTTTTLTYAPYGTDYTLTATVTPIPGTGGGVLFYDFSQPYNPFEGIGLTSGTGSVVWPYFTPGHHQLVAYYPGYGNYGTSSSALVDLTVGGAAQTIAFGSLGDVTYGVAPLTVSATASSGLSPSFTSTPPGVCTVAGTTVTVTGAGNCTVTASQPGNSSYAAATPVAQSFTVNQATQTITFSAPSSPAPNSNVTLTATASSGLAVTYSAANPCTVTGSTLTVGGAGTSCSVTASQAGNTNYNAATSVLRTVTVAVSGLTSQTIIFGSLADQALGSTPPALSATASSGLAVTFTSNSSSVCTVSGVTIALVSAGSCSITASQAGNPSYYAAPSVTQAFNVITISGCTTSLREYVRLGGSVLAIENSCAAH